MSVDPPVTATYSVTRLLDEAKNGDASALERLIPLVYTELHQIARRHMVGEHPDHTLQPTALVHEAFLRLVGGATISFENRSHLLRATSQAMRHVLVDHARARNAAKRGSGLLVTLDDGVGEAGQVEPAIDMLVLDDALTRLAAAEPRWAQVVELRFFGGLEVPEVAEALGVSTATVKRDWRFAKAWLARELGTPGASGRPGDGE